MQNSKGCILCSYTYCKNSSKGLLSGFRKSSKTLLYTTVENHVFWKKEEKLCHQKTLILCVCGTP